MAALRHEYQDICWDLQVHNRGRAEDASSSSITSDAEGSDLSSLTSGANAGELDL